MSEVCCDIYANLLCTCTVQYKHSLTHTYWRKNVVSIIYLVLWIGLLLHLLNLIHYLAINGTSTRNAHFFKKCPLHQEKPTSSKIAHFIRKRRFLIKFPVFDEFRFSATYSTSSHVQLEQVPLFWRIGNFNKKNPLLQEKPTSSRKAHFIKNCPLHQKPVYVDLKRKAQRHVTLITLLCIIRALPGTIRCSWSSKCSIVSYRTQ